MRLLRGESEGGCKRRVRDTDVCADVMWTPTVVSGAGGSKMNAKEWEILSQQSYWLGPRFDWAAGQLSFVRANFNTPMSFVSFPFDTQQLVILLSYHCTLLYLFQILQPDVCVCLMRVGMVQTTRLLRESLRHLLHLLVSKDTFTVVSKLCCDA